MSLSPATILFNTSGSEVSIQKDAPLSASQPGVVIAGTDGSYIRLLRTSGAGDLYVKASTSSPQSVSGTVQTYTSAPQGVTGTVGINTPVQSYTSSDQGISGTVQVYTSGLQGVSGTVSVSNSIQTYTSAPQGITGSVSVTNSLQTFTSGLQGISGTVQTYTSAPQAVTGTVQVYTSGLQGVSGTVNVGSPVQTYTSAPQGVTGSVSVTNAIQTYTSAIQGVSGTVGINTPIQVYTSGPQGITGTISFTPSAPINVYTMTPQGITGTVSLADLGQLDAFGRLRVAEPFTIFDSKQVHDDRQIYWDHRFINGATASYVQYRASTRLDVPTTLGAKATRQTKTRAAYQSGKSLLCITTQVFGTGSAGIVKRVGLFDDYNGVYLVQSGTTNVGVCLRSRASGNPVDTYVPQDSWNIDKLDGNGTSGITLDLSKVSIFITDLQWLGAGRVRTGFEIDGLPHYVHQFTAANKIDSVYMSTPNLPLRYEIENVGGTSTNVNALEQICSTIMSEGGYQPRDLQFSIDRGVTPVSGVTNAGIVPVASIRLNPSFSGSYVLMFKATALCTTNANSPYYWTVRLNPTIAGTNPPTWRQTLSSSVQYDVNRNSTNTMTNGIQLASGYVSAGNTSNEATIESLLSLGTSINGTPDEMCFGVQMIGAGTESFVGGISWKGAT